MSHHSSNKTLRFFAFAAFALLSAAPGCAAEKSKHVILITIDGMRAEMVTDSTMPSPNLKRMRRDGMFVSRIKGITPTATYPSHTTIVTGTTPANHHIYYNRPFLDNQPGDVSYWYADSIKAPTIWDRARSAGLTTASLFWPVSTGAKSIMYNVPEFWSTKPVDNQLAFIKPYCTPEGFLDELEREAVGRLNHDNFWAGTMNRDAKTAYMVNYIMNRYRPNLMTVHLITTDYAQHATGTASDWVSASVGGADHAIGIILENLQRTKMMNSTTVIVCGDHGFVNCRRRVAPNVWLTAEGLLSEKPGGEWKACFHGAGAMAFLYLKDASDSRTLKKVLRHIEALPDSTRALFSVVGKEELEAAGCDPRVALAIEPVNEVAVSTARTGADVVPATGGNHGYMSGIDPTTLVAFGAGIEKGEKAVMDQTDIADWVMKLLGEASPVPSKGRGE